MQAGDHLLSVGNWNLSCGVDGELTIVNVDGQQQATLIREDLPGFVFQSNRGTRHTFTAETSLGPEFSAGWATSSRGGSRPPVLVLPAGSAASSAIATGGASAPTSSSPSKSEAIKQKVRVTARDIYDNYFKAAQSQARGTWPQSPSFL
jgi:E3 ubiquitin-protein ligase HECTD1